MELHEVCDSLVHETEGVQACVFLDLETRLSLAQARRPGVGAVAIRRATRAAGDVFRGRLLRQLVRTLPTERLLEDFVREAQMTTTETHIFMSTVPRWNNAVLVCVTDKAVSIGLGWMAVHQAIDSIGQVPPESLSKAAEPQRELYSEPLGNTHTEQQHPDPLPEPQPVPLPEPKPEAVGPGRPAATSEDVPVARPAEPEPRLPAAKAADEAPTPERSRYPDRTPLATPAARARRDHHVYRGVRQQPRIEPAARTPVGEAPTDRPSAAPEDAQVKKPPEPEETKPALSKLSARAFFTPKRSTKT